MGRAGLSLLSDNPPLWAETKGITKMTAWTENNTEGFTGAELDTLNTAQAALEKAFPKVDEANITDMLNNAWLPGSTADTLIDQISARLNA